MNFDWKMFIKTIAKIILGILAGLAGLGLIVYLVAIFYAGGVYSVGLFMVAFTITAIRSNWYTLSRAFEPEYDLTNLLETVDEMPRGASHLESVTGVVVTTRKGTEDGSYVYRATFEYIGDDGELYVAVEYADTLEELRETIEKGTVKIKEIAR